MSRLLWALLWVVLPVGLPAQSPLRLELERAWRADPAVAPALDADQEAGLVLETARRSWWPSVTLDSPSLVSASGDDQSSAVASTLAASLVQKLPGGGSLTAGASQRVTKPLRHPGGPTDLTTVPTLSLSLVQPLAAFEEGAEDDRLLARLGQEKTLRDLFVAAVRRAAALDTARAVLEARRAALAAAQVQSDLTATWEAQGRATKTEVWKARREADAARWSQDKAALEAEAADRDWLRAAGSPAGRWSLDEVVALGAELAPGTGPSLEDEIAAVDLRRAARSAAREAAAWAPQLSASASSTKPDGQPWQVSGQLGLKWSTDALVLAPLARQKADLAGNRLAQTAQMDARVRQGQREARDRQIEKLGTRLGLLEAETRRQAQVVVETQALVEARQLTQADLATAQADAAQLAADQRTLLWEQIVLEFQNQR